MPTSSFIPSEYFDKIPELVAKPMTTQNQTKKPKHKFVPDSTSPSLNCEVCGESREVHWRNQTEKPSTVEKITSNGFRCWLWPDHSIGARESRKLREEHNVLVNIAFKTEVQRDALLAALRDCVEALGKAGWDDYVGDSHTNKGFVYRDARAAIARAEGGAQ